MTAEILSGTQLAQAIVEEKLIPHREKLKQQGITPKLVVILIGDHPASASYVRQKQRTADKVGIIAETLAKPATISSEELFREIDRLNQDPTVHGMIVQLPLPDHINPSEVLERIDPSKDVDGFHPLNVGKLLLDEPGLRCCTPLGIMSFLPADLSGQKVVVLGRSNIVGKPVAALCLARHATVTICHSRTKDLPEAMVGADIVIVAIGRPEFIKGEDLPAGCTVIDVGIHRREDGSLCGDVCFDTAAERVAKITPVPGGVGPMTVVSLISNTIQAAEDQKS